MHGLGPWGTETGSVAAAAAAAAAGGAGSSSSARLISAATQPLTLPCCCVSGVVLIGERDLGYAIWAAFADAAAEGVSRSIGYL